MPLQTHTAPPSLGDAVLGRTLPALLDEAVARYPNPQAFNQPQGGGWTTLSNTAFREAADEVALGLLEAGLERGDCAAFFMESDLYFALADFGTLIAGIVSAPLYTTYAAENLVYVTEHAEAKALFVSTPEMLAQAAAWLPQVPAVRTVVLAEGALGDTTLPEGVRFLTLGELRGLGRRRLGEHPDEPKQLRAQIQPRDLCTLIYTSGTTGRPKGVMLSHENISSNVLGALSSLGVLDNGDAEVVVTFLPMTHVFARMLTIAHVAWGHTVYFSNPDLLVGHLAEVKPTFFATVPRVLEKVYDKVHLGVQEATGLKKTIGSWALGLAAQYDLSRDKGGLSPIKFALADKLVYAKLREKLGLTRVKTVAVGGAALRADLAQSFNAFGIPVVQGYGLTETSPVITMNRIGANRAGAVGQPIPGVEVAIAEDGEILSRGPHIMLGYYKASDKTNEVVDHDGWFHTGDIGEFTPDGFLKITDRKKALFKLSTGKYVIPSPIENALQAEPLIEQAVVVGSGYKFCTGLIFPSADALGVWAREHGVSGSSLEEWIADPQVVAAYEKLVDRANAGMDHWSQIKRFKLVPDLMTVENELLTPTMKVKRSAVSKAFGGDIEKMYNANVDDRHESVAVG